MKTQQYILKYQPTGTTRAHYIADHTIEDQVSQEGEFWSANAQYAEKFNGLQAVQSALDVMEKNSGAGHASALQIIPCE